MKKIIQKVRLFARTNSHLRQFIAFKLVPSGLFDKIILNMELDKYWERRLNETIKCKDNNYIPRVKNAGEVIKGKQIMHNGLNIYLGSYYGPEVSKILYLNKGVHEPQEERVFQEIINIIPEGATMIEMGSFWSFYSMWFNRKIKSAKNYMIEPEIFNLKCGQRNFELNNMKGHFTNAFVGQFPENSNKTPVINIDSFISKHNISYINLLHSDIQGYEYDMLLGANKAFENQRIGFVFISTHSHEVHEKCLLFLKKYSFLIVTSVGISQTYSEDGLIVASSPNSVWKKQIQVDLK